MMVGFKPVYVPHSFLFLHQQREFRFFCSFGSELAFSSLLTGWQSDLRPTIASLLAQRSENTCCVWSL